MNDGEWLRLRDAARVAGVGRTKMHRLLEQGVVPYAVAPDGSARFVLRDDAEAYRRRAERRRAR
jgi:hypothetical protein